MIILISQKTIVDKHGARQDALDTAYLNFFKIADIFSQKAVFIPVPNNLEHAASLVDKIKPSLIILTGGNNVDPKLFGSDIMLGDLAPERDEVEKFLFDYAVANAIAVLGICRGFQYMNVLLGGRLTLNILDHPPAVGHTCLFEGHQHTVNSYHNQAIMPSDLASLLKPLVVAEKSGNIEAYAGKIKGKSGIAPILGVQWHPERPCADTDLFRTLIKQHLDLGV